MSSPRRIARLYSAANSHEVPPAHQLNARARRTRTAPPPDVMAAVEFLLAEPDAYLYRRRYLDLITHTLGPDGTAVTDYTAAEKYLLTADRCRRAIQRTTDLYAVPTRKPGNDASR
ncbi:MULTISPECIES: hypothetical protein [Rhodococcus]|jgi:hypothetical protein|nr:MULTISPECIES: hypothetical protein [Rhodococcus]MCJ0905989.1 hypothetical protein [Rhodococcus sp. ARC_M6]MCQ4128867.1 hypothetical protein [Rhodococcus erythropolis]MDV6212596.1 hypothetical protein [Rhodococcus erythropolis]UPU46270.1 hypothetical protein M0639_30435 [Rhodococcus qingshengii JCM 15477]GCB59668.1 hypothetical protein rerp_60760 [Rhodococcus erythropolis]